MRRGALLTTLLLFASLVVLGLATVQAEHTWEHRYTISGKITNSDGSTARGVQVGIDCGDGQTDEDLCGHNAETTVNSGLTGRYELTLHLHDTADEGKLVLTANGDDFLHIIDMDGADGAAEEIDRYVDMDIALSGSVSQWSYFIPRLALLVVGIATILIVMKNRGWWIFKQAAVERVGKGRVPRDDLVPCPKCSAELKESNLIRHLTQKHFMQKSTAEELLGISSTTEAKDSEE